MNKAYSRINWQNQPNTSTALGATNLNKMDIALNSIDDRVITLDTTKLDLTTANSMVKSFSLNQSTGVITITLLDGTVTTYDTKLEKLAVNFAYDATAQQLVITLDDGTKQYVDMSALITQYEFSDSSTVGFSVDSNGKVSAGVKKGSITPEQLQPNYLAEITTQQQTATAQAKLSKRYAVGGVETGDTTDNAKYYKEQAELFKTQAKQYRDEAQDISGVGIAAESKLGLVKGNGNVAVQSDGSMWANPYKDVDTQTGTFITSTKADEALAQVNIKGATTVTPVNPDLPISPDNKATLVSAVNFDLVSTGKNVADIMKTTSTTSGVTIIEHSKNKLKFSAVKGASKNVQINNCVWLEKGESYKISRKFNIISGAEHASPTTGLMRLFKTVNGVYTLKDVGVGTNEVTYVSVPETGYWHLTFFITGNAETTGDIVIEFTDIQVEKGTVLSSYENYKEDRINIPYDMGEFNEIKDGNYIKGGETVVFNGSENWETAPSVAPNTARFNLNYSDLKIDEEYVATLICDKLPTITFRDIYQFNTTIKNAIASYNMAGRFSIRIDTSYLVGWSESLTSSEKITLFKNYLSSNNIKVRYKKATPIVTPLNTYLKTFKGVTNIFTNATPQPEITATFKPQLWADLYNHQNAINSKIDDKKRVNNLLSTDPTTVLSGSMGKQLKDEIDAMNNNMPKQINYWSDTQKNLLAKINDVSDPTFRTVIINGWDSVFTDSDMPYRNTVWHIAIYNNGRDINVWQRWTNLDNGSIYMRLYNPSSSSWGNWINNDLKSVTYTGITESYATPNGKYAYLALPVAKDSAKNLLVNVVNDEYIVHATYHNAYNWLALITKVDDSVPLSTSLTVNYTLIN